MTICTQWRMLCRKHHWRMMRWLRNERFPGITPETRIIHSSAHSYYYLSGFERREAVLQQYRTKRGVIACAYIATIDTLVVYRRGVTEG